MNIGSLIRGLLGDNKPGEPKAVELKEGQVVRGVVLSVSDSGKEAVVQIQGTPVRAELETPLQPGQTLNLQVAPPGENGLPVLKAVPSGEAALGSPQSMAEALKALGLTDSKAGKEILQAMVSGGVALTKETAAKLDAVMNAKPPNVSAAEWLEAAVISVKRGLPVTAESVKGLQQAVFGPKLHQLVAELETAIGLWAQQENEAAGGNSVPKASGQPAAAAPGALAPGGGAVNGNASAPAAPAAGQENAPGADSTNAARLTSAQAGSPAGGGSAEPPGTMRPAGTGKAEQPAGNAPAAMAGNAAAEAEGPEAASAGKAVPAASPLPAHEGAAGRPGAQPERSTGPAAEGAAAGQGAATPPAAPAGTALLAKLQGVLTELRGTLPQLTASPPADAAGAEPAPAPAGQRGDKPSAAAAQQTGAAAAPDTESWVGRLLKLLGAEHEQQAVRGGGNAAAEARASALPQAGAAGGGDAAADTLKGVLLQVLGSSEAPPAVREAAGQLVQQLTGQQLLLNTDRTAPFAQVTLFLPLRGPDGQETASVHIQSRRGRKGELDAANCRLWFDLDMKQLGQTLVDVQVVDRIVSLKLHNDTPWVLELLEERKDEIEAAVESIGYQLLSLRTEPLPQPNAASASIAGSAGKLADYVPDSYKGVDYRI
ncbi:hypothetical protein [Paenibacillus sp. S150]|uniref:hypothetical protein n=1 Tax=Paenibacillus sp. S150 TaxID=2749826 RepID=UPI001C564BE5|nr:hypothetical protein [Paenibacillus sp. S150]MBW4083223.1 hypothetical protein [Paenibacillus sp. S150]